MKFPCAGLLMVCLLCACGAREEVLSHGRFEKVVVVRPSGVPKSVALLLTDRNGWNDSARRLAYGLTRDGTLVVGIPLPLFYSKLEKEIDDCEYTDGDLENLSRFVQAYSRLPTYVVPILVGLGEGAAFAYANLAQAPVGTFAGALTLGFCPRLHLQQKLCAGEGLASKKRAENFELLPAKKMPAPWIALQSDADNHCPVAEIQDFANQVPLASVVQKKGILDFAARIWRDPMVAAYASLAKQQFAVAAPSVSELADLPLIEVPAEGIQTNSMLAILWSGDGGWAGLDKDLAAALSQAGVAVIGVDSLRYFWAPRTPEDVAADINRIIRTYSAAWRRDQILLVGYSQGADVLPFALNRLTPADRVRVKLAVAIGLSDHAVFEFQLSNWLADNNNGPETKPEVQKIQGLPFLCIYGEDDDDAICPQLNGAAVRVVKLPGGHHFNGDYGRLAEEILATANGTEG